jgi:hypothetical protein
MKKKITVRYSFVLFFKVKLSSTFFFFFLCFECCVKWSPSFVRSCAVLCLYSFEDRILLELSYYIIRRRRRQLKWKEGRALGVVAPLDKWQEPRYYQSMSIRRDQDPLSLSLSLGPLGSSVVVPGGIVENS